MSITAKIIALSIAPDGQLIVTWELEYQRFIHGEFMTHRLFSRNAASSRAIPINSMIQAVFDKPAAPIHWGKNQPGMQAKEELEPFEMAHVMLMWEEAAYEAAISARAMDLMGAHKQVANRILEPFQWMKTVMTATCMENFFWLRNHEDAQPEIRELARLMWEALEDAVPRLLKPGEWHMPYFNSGYWTEKCGVSLADALAISSSCCAQVSFRKLDDTLEKAHFIYNKLVESEPVHASPFEHQATPMKRNADFRNKGITHKDRAGNFWSNNFVGWIQHRALIPNNVAPRRKGK